MFFFIEANIESTNITYLQILRIFILYLGKKLEEESSLDHIIFFPKISKSSSFNLAKDLNIKEIINLTEFSLFFPAYLQFGSNIMYNYYKKSFPFSLELIFVMKHFLLSNYEDFIFTIREASHESSYQSENENITVIKALLSIINPYIV